jgi:hypothetical protein
MNAPLSFLAGLNANDRQSEIPAQSFAKKLVDRERAKEVPANPIDWHNGRSLYEALAGKGLMQHVFDDRSSGPTQSH